MATLENMKKVVAVKLDPAESNSTGGVVEWVGYIYKKIGSDPVEWETTKYHNNSEYRVFEYTDDEQGNYEINWIMQDKTGIIYNPQVGIEE